MAGDPSRIVEIDGFHIPTLLTFRSEGNSVTVVEISHVEVRAQLPDELFTQRVLEFGDERVGVRMLSAEDGE